MRVSRLHLGILTLLAICLLSASAWWLQESRPPVEKISIAAFALPGVGLFFVAEAQDFFRAQGIEVSLQKHQVGKAALAALFKNEVTYAVSGDTPLVFAMAGGKELDILTTVYSPREGISIIALKDRVRSPEGLRGKRLGVTFASSGQFVADTFLQVHGLAQDRLTVLDMSQHDMTEALLAGKIDAACLWQPYLAEAGLRLGDRGSVFPSHGIYTFRLSLVANRGHADRHPEQVRKLLAALKLAQDYIMKNPEDSLRIMSKATGIAESSFMTFFDAADYMLGLEQGLLLALEDQTRWAIKRGMISHVKMPNYLDQIQSAGLRALSPESVKIVP